MATGKEYLTQAYKIRFGFETIAANIVITASN